jgi:hypothetical protein
MTALQLENGDNKMARADNTTVIHKNSCWGQLDCPLFFKKRKTNAKFAITKGLQTHDIITSSSMLVA